MKQPLSALSLFLWIIQYVPLVCWQSSSLAALSEERGSPLLSLPNAKLRSLPIVAYILLSVLSTVKRALRRHISAQRLSLVVMWHALNTHRLQLTLHWFSQLLRWNWVCILLRVTRRSSAMSPVMEESLVLNSLTPRSGPQTLLSHGLLCHVAVCLRFQEELWNTRILPCDSENLNMSAETLIYPCFYSYVALRTPECCDLCTSLSASAVLWFPHWQSKELKSLWDVGCVPTVKAEEPLRGPMLLLHHHMEWLLKNVMITLTLSYKAVLHILFNVNIIYFLLCCIYGVLLLSMEWSSFFFFLSKVLKPIALYSSFLLWDCSPHVPSHILTFAGPTGFLFEEECWGSRTFVWLILLRLQSVHPIVFSTSPVSTSV